MSTTVHFYAGIGRASQTDDVCWAILYKGLIEVGLSTMMPEDLSNPLSSGDEIPGAACETEVTRGPRRDSRKQKTHQALLDAALQLSSTGRSFAQISLREITRTAGVVPAAFYRHFDDMETLGVELAERVCVSLQDLLLALRQSYATPAFSRTRLSIEVFFHSVHDQPDHWRFIVAERWGGVPKVRELIDQEINRFTLGLTQDVKQLPAFAKMNEADLTIMSELLINLAFAWAMRWLNDAATAEQRELSIQRTTRQSQLLLRGISHWRSEPIKDAPQPFAQTDIKEGQ